tara:strand:- start:329 stop:835 length:507 start_codon:yes stop_codon:yes gene_type:complete
MKKNLNIDTISAFFIDFDGVLTDNKLLLSENGKESVVCSRSDGLAFKALKKLKKNIYIISSESNMVVKARAKKLKTTVFSNVQNKLSLVKRISIKNNYHSKNLVFIGNDINDFHAMNYCKYRACPCDSNLKIMEIANIKLKSRGGEGVVRELIENYFNIDILDLLYSN